MTDPKYKTNADGPIARDRRGAFSEKRKEPSGEGMY